MSTCTYVYMYICIYVWMDVWMHVWMDGCIDVYMYVYITPWSPCSWGYYKFLPHSVLSKYHSKFHPLL